MHASNDKHNLQCNFDLAHIRSLTLNTSVIIRISFHNFFPQIYKRIEVNKSLGLTRESSKLHELRGGLHMPYFSNLQDLHQI